MKVINITYMAFFSVESVLYQYYNRSITASNYKNFEHWLPLGMADISVNQSLKPFLPDYLMTFTCPVFFLCRTFCQHPLNERHTMLEFVCPRPGFWKQFYGAS
jgi:hypothetical protein